MIAVTACYRIETRGMKAISGVRRIKTPAGDRASDVLDAALLRDEPVSLLLSTGFCGGLQPELQIGDLVLADTIWHRGKEIRVARDLLGRVQQTLDRFGTRTGPCASVSFVADGEKKRELAGTGAISVDMESGPLADWACRREVPFLMLRVVLDPLDADLPFSIDRSVVASLARHPIWSALIVRSAARAGRRLGIALNELLPALKEGS